ncbi:MAG TPA: ferritin-like domain-containing protein, partial [Anaeromyxobacter sp.]|nr:ferritin-like domain-containing protein [Anaeromyxobacter sp.]
KVGVLMVSSGLSGKPLHPTNLHVNKRLFPNDTVQGRLPDPGWLDRWLAEQIRFDRQCEERVVRAILRSLSALFGERFETARDLNRFRKGGSVSERPAAVLSPAAAGSDVG